MHFLCNRSINFIQTFDLDLLHTHTHTLCLSSFAPEDLILRGDVSFGAEEFFENEAKMATRLANFISAFLQVSDPLEVYSGKRIADKPLTEDQMIGETLALVVGGGTKIFSAGAFWERNKFTNRTFFAPYAYKTDRYMRNLKVEDLARLNKTGNKENKQKILTHLCNSEEKK